MSDLDRRLRDRFQALKVAPPPGLLESSYARAELRRARETRRGFPLLRRPAAVAALVAATIFASAAGGYAIGHSVGSPAAPDVRGLLYRPVADCPASLALTLPSLPPEVLKNRNQPQPPTLGAPSGPFEPSGEIPTAVPVGPRIASKPLVGAIEVVCWRAGLGTFVGTLNGEGAVIPGGRPSQVEADEGFVRVSYDIT